MGRSGTDKSSLSSDRWMVARILVLVFAAMLLLPGARAEDERRILYLHDDGTLGPTPTRTPVDEGSFVAAPATAAYVLRAGAALEVPTAIVGQEGVHAQLRVNGATIGSVSTPIRALDLGASTATVSFDNPEKLIAMGDVLSVHLEDSGPSAGLVSGLLHGFVGSSSAPRLVIQAGAPPEPILAPSPPPATPTPPTSAPPVTNTTTIVYWPVAPTNTPATPTDASPVDGADDVRSDPGAINREALATTFSAMPNVPPASMLMLMLLATAAIGLVTLFRLGRR